MMLQASRNADGLPILAMKEVGTGNQIYKVPDGEGRLNLYNWVSALDGIPDDDLVAVCQLAQKLQAERNERYFRAGLLHMAVIRWHKDKANQLMKVRERERQEAEDEYRQVCAQIGVELGALTAEEYARLAEPVATQLMTRVTPEKRRLWADGVWEQTVRQGLIKQLAVERLNHRK